MSERQEVKLELGEVLRREPIKGQCSRSYFMNGWHRAELFRCYSILDGGAPGDVCKWRCADCNKIFKRSGAFLMLNQPSIIKRNPRNEAGRDRLGSTI